MTNVSGSVSHFVGLFQPSQPGPLLGLGSDRLVLGTDLLRLGQEGITASTSVVAISGSVVHQVADFGNEAAFELNRIAAVDHQISRFSYSVTGTVKVVGAVSHSIGSFGQSFSGVVPAFASTSGQVLPFPMIAEGIAICAGTVAHLIDDFFNLSDGLSQHQGVADTEIDPFVNSAAAVQVDETIAGLPDDAIPLLLDPDWSSSYDVTYSFYTTITRSRSGVEQRRSRRMRPRKNLSFDGWYKGLAARELRNRVASWLSRRFTVQEHPSQVLTTSPMAAFALSAIVDDVPLWLLPGVQVALRYGQTMQSRYVVDVDRETRSVRFFASTAFAWPAGTIICPSRLGRLSSPQAVQWFTDDVAKFKVSFDVEPVTEPLIDPGAALQFHQGIEVFLKRPNWGRTVSHSFSANIDEMSYESGVKDYYDYEDFRENLIEMTYLNRSPSEIMDVLRVFIRSRGRQKTFFVPSWTNDLRVVFPFAAGADTLIVEGATAGNLLYDDRVHRHVAIRLRDGSVLTRQVEDISPDGDYSSLRLASPLPDGVSIDTIIMICWLYRVRFASDNLTISYLTSQVAEAKITMIARPGDLA